MKLFSFLWKEYRILYKNIALMILSLGLFLTAFGVLSSLCFSLYGSFLSNVGTLNVGVRYPDLETLVRVENDIQDSCYNSSDFLIGLEFKDKSYQTFLNGYVDPESKKFVAAEEYQGEKNFIRYSHNGKLITFNAAWKKRLSYSSNFENNDVFLSDIYASYIGAEVGDSFALIFNEEKTTVHVVGTYAYNQYDSVMLCSYHLINNDLFMDQMYGSSSLEISDLNQYDEIKCQLTNNDCSFIEGYQSFERLSSAQKANISLLWVLQIGLSFVAFLILNIYISFLFSKRNQQIVRLKVFGYSDRHLFGLYSFFFSSVVLFSTAISFAFYFPSMSFLQSQFARIFKFPLIIQGGIWPLILCFFVFEIVMEGLLFFRIRKESKGNLYSYLRSMDNV